MRDTLAKPAPAKAGVRQLPTEDVAAKDPRLQGDSRTGQGGYFQQDHPPGREAQVDFTHCTELGVTIGGEPFRHLLFQFVLSRSGWPTTRFVAGGVSVPMWSTFVSCTWPRQPWSRRWTGR